MSSDYIEINDSYDRGTYARSSAPGFRSLTFSSIMTRVYAWMTIALLLTAGTAYFTASSSAMMQLIFSNSAVVWILFLAELGLVLGISASINRLASATAVTLFLLYSVINGLTLSVIFYAYDLGLIYQAFAATALTFGGMSLFGFTTQRDLSGLRSYLLMALIGLIIASVVNIFLASSGLDALITYAGVFLFVGLTAYDTQKIKQLSAAAQQGNPAASGSALATRISILGALTLYLDFINLFLYLLRFFGRSRE